MSETERGADDKKGGACHLNTSYQLLVLPAGQPWSPSDPFD